MDEPSTSGTSASSTEWTSDELRTLYHCINLRGAHEGSMDYICCRIDTRSKDEIRQKLAELRSLIKKNKERRRNEQLEQWLSLTTESSSSCPIRSWLDAVFEIQNNERKISDRTYEALRDFLLHGMLLPPEEAKQMLLCSDSMFVPSRGRVDEVDFGLIHQFLRAAVNTLKFKTDLKTLDSAILVDIIDEIQKEVDNPTFDHRRKILAGMFCSIQNGDLSDYDFRYSRGFEDTVSVQINPFNLTPDMLDLKAQNESAADDTVSEQ